MALFDRRLLAYLDDGWAGSGTLHERIVGYQQDLNEIERELFKYQHVLGPDRVRVKARDRHRWFSQHRQPPTAEEIFGCQLESPQPVVSQHHLQPSKAHADVAQVLSEPRPSHARRRLSSGTSAASSPRPSLSEPLPQGKSGGTSERRPSHRLPPQSRRPSAVAEPAAKIVDVPQVHQTELPPEVPVAAPVVAAEVPARESLLDRLRALPRSELQPHWAQVDTLHISKEMKLHAGSELVVRGRWLGKEKDARTDPRPVQAQEQPEFPQKCKVRQQLKLEGTSDVRVIELQILEIGAQGEKELGVLWLDAMEARNKEQTVKESLYSKDGRKLSSQLMVKLATMAERPRTSTGHVVSQDPAATGSGAKEAPRISVTAAGASAASSVVVPGTAVPAKVVTATAVAAGAVAAGTVVPAGVVQATVVQPAASGEQEEASDAIEEEEEDEEEELIYEEEAEEEQPDDDEEVADAQEPGKD